MREESALTFRVRKGQRQVQTWTMRKEDEEVLSGSQC
jgi:hypothetical protein